MAKDRGYVLGQKAVREPTWKKKRDRAEEMSKIQSNPTKIKLQQTGINEFMP